VNKLIGILAGMEWDHFPMALIERINQVPGFQAELAKIDATPENFTKQYDVLVDRISHEVPFYRFHLKAAMLAGTYVINDPFWFSADDKFFGFSLAQRIGVTVPRTVMLPQREYIPAIDPKRSLNNLIYPLDWEGIARYVGFPAILKPADGGGWRNVNRVNDMGELMDVYNGSGQLVLTLQQFIEFDDYVRCLAIGREHVRMIRYSVKTRGYLPDKDFLPAALEARILDSARELNRALGYDMNSLEFAIKDGVPYAIDFTNPAPDMYPHHILAAN
jgi:glutathione synthase/RimK-type ligase-like ATP-grasp enzyme